MPYRDYSGDWHFGSLNKRELTIRPIVSIYFRKWDGGLFSLSWSKLLSPVAWWKVLRDRWSWRASARYFNGATHRCYCDTGTMFDGDLVLFGFGFLWFYSNFTGSVPCPCDVARGDSEDEGEQ